MTLGLLEDIPPDRWCWQPLPGFNHAAWVAMHIALADDWGPTSLGQPEKRWVDRYGDLVSAGPADDTARWPSRDEIMAVMEASHERFMACFEGVTEADLERPTSGPIADFAPNLGTLLDSHIWHEGFHGGQLSVIRKALGLPPKFG